LSVGETALNFVDRIAEAPDIAEVFDLMKRRRDAAKEEIPDVMFALHAVLETALQRLRGDWYH
jgi:hypothetical protein